MIVFTQYDKLVRSKEAELLEENPNLDPTRLHELSVEEAQKEFKFCVQSLQHTVDRLGIPMPPYARVSGTFASLYCLVLIDHSLVRPGHPVDVADLVKVTRDVVKERVKGDAWVLWAIAQRASLPVKIDTCVA